MSPPCRWLSFDIAGLSSGPHELAAESDTGARTEGSFTLSDGEPRWLVADYWFERFDEAGSVELCEWSLAASHLHRTRAFVALDVPEAGDPETLLEASIAAAPTHGVHPRFTALYRAFPRARAGDVAAVVRTVNEALDLSLAHGAPNAYSDTALAAAELLEHLDRLDDAAAIVAALHRQTFTFPELYHRYRRARSRLPSAPNPDRRLTAPELHDIVRARLANLTAQLATIGTEALADSPDPPRT